jgi:hypothetical protein
MYLRLRCCFRTVHCLQQDGPFFKSKPSGEGGDFTGRVWAGTLGPPHLASFFECMLCALSEALWNAAEEIKERGKFSPVLVTTSA